MTKRRVIVTLELETCETLRELRRAARWQASGIPVVQAQANVIQPPKRKGRRVDSASARATRAPR